MHSCLATDVWLGAAMIELKHYATRTLDAHKRRVRRARILLFVASVFTPLGDYYFSGLQKTRWQRFIHLRGKRKRAYSLDTLSGSAPLRPKRHRCAWAKVSCRESADREGRYAQSRRAKEPRISRIEHANTSATNGGDGPRAAAHNNTPTVERGDDGGRPRRDEDF